MTPILKSDKLNVTLIERKLQNELTSEDEASILHRAGGPFTGFIINKLASKELNASLSREPCHLSFKLNVYMRRSSNSEIQQETRCLEFWFIPSTEEERMSYSHNFFQILFRDNFPKDYFTFILRLMQLLRAFSPIKKLKLDIATIGTPLPLGSPIKQKDPKQFETIVSEKILELLERAFPNTVSVDELARLTECDTDFTYELLRGLFTRNLVKYYDDGNSWMRNIVNTQDEQTHEVIMIQQNPTIRNDNHPTIAIITVNYYEKLAVDSMMENKLTYVRQKPEGLGESNVYTVGNIGAHRVVSTKLPSLGRGDSRSSKISSGNTTTRLLGIFQKIEHVLLVGVAGGVPHYTDYSRHTRRGDIIISYPQSEENDYVYAHFETQKSQSSNEIIWKTWKPGSMELYKVVNNIRKTYNPQLNKVYPWEEYLKEGINSLNNEELDCRKPKDDKLFFTVGEKNVIEVNHPEYPSQQKRTGPVLHFGAIGGGEKLIKDESIRQKLSDRFGIIGFDSDVDQVMESIDGNRKESFIIIRAISDYYDGSTSKEWQPYASLCAAAFTKTLLCALPETIKSPVY